MEIKVLEESKNKLIIELEGEDHTLANLLKKELWNDEHVKTSGYSVEHPLIGRPKIVVETDGKESPRDALKAASERLSKENDKFKKAVAKEL